MKNLRIIITVVIISVIAIFIGSAIRSYYLFLKEPVLPVINAIPENSAVIISTKSAYKLFETINNTALVDLFGSENSSYNQINNYLDSINLRSNKIRKLLESTDVLISLSPHEDYTHLLIACSIGKISNKTINNEIRKLLSYDSCTINRSSSDLMKISSIRGELWYYTRQGILSISNDSTLLISSLTGLNSQKNLGSDTSLVRLIEARGKRVDANLIINTKILANAIWPDKANNLWKGTPFDNWISFDLSIKKNSIAMGGFTSTGSEHLFRGQEPVESTIYKLYPRNTSLAVSLSLSDIALYSRHFIKSDTLQVEGYDATIKENTKEIFRPADHIRSWIGNSVSVIFTNDYFRNISSGQVVLIECKDRDSAAFYLRPYIQPVNDSSGRLYYTSFAPDLFGEIFKLKGPLYYTISDNFVTISPDRNLLYTGSKSNWRIKDIDAINENSGKSSNISIMVHPQVIARWLKNKNPNKPLLSFLSRQSSIGFQYSAGGKLEYTSAWINPDVKSKALFAETEYHNKPQKEAATIIKEDTELLSATDKIAENDEKPDVYLSESDIPAESITSKEVKIKSAIKGSFIINGIVKNKKCIALITENGELTVVDSEGKKQWHFKGKEPLLPFVNEVDQNKDGRIEYLAGSRNFLYHIDSKGELISKPTKLPEPAAGSFSVLDYDSKRDYRILYVGTDNKIYNLTFNGTELPDWQKPSVTGKGEISFIRTNGRDYLIYHSGNSLKIFDRRGKERIKTDKSLNISNNTVIAENKTNSKGIFLGSSKSGELTYINQSGIISSSSFGSFNNDPHFNYFDFDSDGSMDFIFTDKSRIAVYNRMKELIAEKKGNYTKPFIYSASGNDTWIFARNQKTNEIVSINNKKRALGISSIYSDSDPLVFNPGGSDQELLVTSLKGKLILTPLKEL